MTSIRKFTKPITIAISIICIGVIVYALIDGYYTRDLLRREGVETIAIVENSWRGRCGSGYGNFAYYSFKVNDVIYRDTSSCNAPKVLQINEKFHLLYMEDNPNINRILFEKPVK